MTRGTRFSFDKLPPLAVPHLRAACRAVTERKRTVEHIREELNLHLLALGYGPISRSAFHRQAKRARDLTAQLEKTREMAALYSEQIARSPASEVNSSLHRMVADVLRSMRLATPVRGRVKRDG